MAQFIDVQKEEEDGKIIIKSKLNFVFIHNKLWEQNNCQYIYPWLTSINEYGNTVFNELQAPKVINELKILLEKVHDEEIKKYIRELIDFMILDIHEYVRFIGD